VRATGPKDGARHQKLSSAQLSRLSSGADAPDLFPCDLKHAQREQSSDALDREYEYQAMKREVRRTAKDSAEYDRGIKAGVKRLRY
jgi:hypothetical protein